VSTDKRHGGQLYRLFKSNNFVLAFADGTGVLVRRRVDSFDHITLKRDRRLLDFVARIICQRKTSVLSLRGPCYILKNGKALTAQWGAAVLLPARPGTNVSTYRAGAYA
jgi:hypothetical protein